MKIEDRTEKEVLFSTLEVGDVFKDSDNLYLKIDPLYMIEPNGNIIEDIEVEDFLKDRPIMNAYDFISHDFVCIDDRVTVQPVKATLVIE